MSEPLLTPDDLQSSVWLKIKRHYETKLESYRNKLEGNLLHEDTTKLRGRIAEVKGILALDKPQD